MQLTFTDYWRQTRVINGNEWDSKKISKLINGLKKFGYEFKEVANGFKGSVRLENGTRFIEVLNKNNTIYYQFKTNIDDLYYSKVIEGENVEFRRQCLSLGIKNNNGCWYTGD